MAIYKYPRNAKLKQGKVISTLFDKGKWKSKGNLRIIVLQSHPEISIVGNKVGVSVSKRFYKKAVDRNRIKRLLREAYRLHKDLFSESFGPNTYAMIFWTSSEKPSHYSQVEEEFIKLCKSNK